MKYLEDGFVYFQSKKDLRQNENIPETQYYFIDEIKRSCAFYFYENDRRFVLTASYANVDQTPPEYYISDLQARKRKQVVDLDTAKSEIIKAYRRKTL
ncbi:MAG: hypothetical protein IKU29_11655 [Parabacteroides sp.]|nr:hypothetical protein [Parabacteroides sp.]